MSASKPGYDQRVLVTGATGFIGRAVIARLAAHESYRAVALERAPFGAVTQPPLAGAPERTEGAVQMELLTCNDLAHDALPSFDGVDTVIHLAGTSSDTGEAAAARWPDPRGNSSLSTNGWLVDRVVRRAVRDRVRRVVLVSSVKVHGERSVDVPLREISPIRPTGSYAESKAESERVFQRLAGDRLETVIVRPVLVYGPGAGGNFARLAALARTPVPKPFIGVQNARTLLGVHNLADLLVRCISHPDAAGEAFLAGDAETVSTAALLRLMASASGRRAWLVPGSAALLQGLGRVVGASRAVDRLVQSLEVDTTKARDRLGWTPPHSLAEGIRQAIAPSEAHLGAFAPHRSIRRRE